MKARERSVTEKDSLSFWRRWPDSNGYGLIQSVPHNRNGSPLWDSRFGKEEGTYGYGAFLALTETREAEWSKFLLTWNCKL